MSIDIRTLIVVLGITHLIQFAVFFQQYRINKTYNGVVWWLMWSAAEVIGFGSMLLREIASIHLMAIMVQNSMIFLGTIFIYIGVMRFLGREVKRTAIFSVFAVFIAAFVYFVYVDNNIAIRGVIICGALATISFLTARALLIHKMPSIAASANFNAAIFLVHGGVFTHRTVMIIAGTPVDLYFTPTLFNYVPYLDALLVSLLWTFGFIIMLNQQLNAEITRDITDRKLAEKVLLKNARLLRRAEEMARLGNWEFFLDENKLQASEGAGAIYGLENKEWCVSDVQNIPLPEYRPILDRALKDLIERGISYNVEFKICRPTDGKIIDIHSMAEYDSAKNVVFGVIQDVTDHMRTEKERDTLQIQLRHAQKMEAIGTLAGGVAHDFNNILTAIIGYGGLAKMNVKDDATTLRYMQQILEAANRAGDLTKRLLAFSRKQIIEPVLIDLNEIVGSIEKMLGRIMTEDIELSTVLSAVELPVLVDIGQVEQVVINLAANARDAMPDGGRLVIQTDAVNVDSRYAEAHIFEKMGMYAVLTVSDTGVGMDQETKENIFEPFFTTKEVGKGTGLGLSMVYGIIKQHNGNIDVHSEVGKGTTFRIYLPLTQTKRGEISKPVQALPGGKGETIIVAEDELQVREIIMSFLQKNGYKIIEAENGEEAIRKFKKNRGVVSLILLDVIMPVKNGREAYEEIKGIEPGVKTIFMSGYTDDIISRKGILEEGFDFISKPINPDTLMRKIRDVLDR